MLIAQELTYYGLDIYKKRMLADLLHRLADVKGLEWIRLHYAYPQNFLLEILDVMRERENICNYLDMPLAACGQQYAESDEATDHTRRNGRIDLLRSGKKFREYVCVQL